jgi:hypothetical protein
MKGISAEDRARLAMALPALDSEKELNPRVLAC